MNENLNVLSHLWFAIIIEGGAAASCASFSIFISCDVAKGPGGPGKGQSSLIFGGTETKPHAYPSVVTLQQDNPDGSQSSHYCTALLIHESWVGFPIKLNLMNVNSLRFGE